MTKIQLASIHFLLTLDFKAIPRGEAPQGEGHLLHSGAIAFPYPFFFFIHDATGHCTEIDRCSSTLNFLPT